MTAQVIFINTFYYPDEEERRRLKKLQDALEIFQAEIEYQSMNFTDFQKFIFKEASHNNMKQKWVLVKRSE